jgi:hypothetical protein
MKSTNTNCLLSGGFAPLAGTSTADRQVDALTTQAFRNLRIQSEELALELAVRLRVLGRGLFAGCKESVTIGKRTSGGTAAYAALRLQLHQFLSSQTEDGSAEEHHLHAVQHYLQDLLPLAHRGGCLGRTECLVQQVETAIAILSGTLYENEDLGKSR